MTHSDPAPRWQPEGDANRVVPLRRWPRRAQRVSYTVTLRYATAAAQLLEPAAGGASSPTSQPAKTLWRTLKLPSDVSLDRVHRIAQLLIDGMPYKGHVFATSNPTTTPATVIMPAAGLVQHNAEGVPSEAIGLDEVLRTVGDSIFYLVDFDAPQLYSLHLDAIDPQVTVPETLCIGGEGSGIDADQGVNYSLEDINAELDAERWVVETLSAARSSLASLILRTGTWEFANLLALVGLDTAPRVDAADAADMVAPFTALLEVIAARTIRFDTEEAVDSRLMAALIDDSCWTDLIAQDGGTPHGVMTVAQLSSLRKCADALDLIQERGGHLTLTRAGRRGLSDPVVLFHHIAHRLPAERHGPRVDAAWLLILGYLAGVPWSSASLVAVEGMQWAGWRTSSGENYTVDAIHRAASLTVDTLSHLRILQDRQIRIGGKGARTRREFLRVVVQRRVSMESLA